MKWLKLPDGRLVSAEAPFVIDAGVTHAGQLTCSFYASELWSQPYGAAGDLAAAMDALALALGAEAFGPVANPALSAPTLVSIVPNTCVAADGTTFYITGTNLAMGATVTINGVAASSPVYESGTKQYWSIYGGELAAGGPYDVVVTNPDGQTATLAAAFTAT